MTNIDTQETDYSVYADILLAWSQLHWNCYMFLFKICFLSQCQQKKTQKKCPNNKYRHTRDRLFGLISAQLKSHLMWSKVELPEATSPEVTGNDVTGNHVTGGDRVRMRNRFPRFFLTIVVAHNVPLRMTDMATGCDVIKLHVTSKEFRWKGGVLACATRSCAISAQVGPFNRKWRHQTSCDHVEFPLQ